MRIIGVCLVHHLELGESPYIYQKFTMLLSNTCSAFGLVGWQLGPEDDISKYHPLLVVHNFL